MVNGTADSVSIQHLEFKDPPLPSTGGRIMTPAGELAQIISGDTIRLVTYIEFKPNGKPRGNHFHKNKTEIIYIIAGSLELTVENMDDLSQQTFNLKAGDLVKVAPNFAHTYTAHEYTQALEMNSVPYDPSDTFPYTLHNQPTRS